MRRKEAEVNMEGHFLVRQIYDDDVTYNIVGAAERVLSKIPLKIDLIFKQNYIKINFSGKIPVKIRCSG